MANTYPIAIRDDSGVERLAGEIDFTDPDKAALPQGGPLTQDLACGGFSIVGAPSVNGGGGRLNAANAGGSAGGAVAQGGDGPAGAAGGDAVLAGGTGDNGAHGAASVLAEGGGAAAAGKLKVFTGGRFGFAGEALVSDGTHAIYAGVQVAAAVPVGAPTGLPFAVDTTAVTGGLYVWNGAAWVKVSTLP